MAAQSAVGPGKPRDSTNKFPALEATRRMNSLNNPTAVDGLLYSQIAAMAAMSDMMRARDSPSQAVAQGMAPDSAPAFDKAMLERLAKQAAEEPTPALDMAGFTGTSSASSAPPPPPPPISPPSPPQDEPVFKLPPGFKMVRFDTAEEAEKAISELDRCEASADPLSSAEALANSESASMTPEASLAVGAATRGWGRGEVDVGIGGNTSQVRSIVDGVLGAWKATAATSRASAALAPQAKTPSAASKAPAALGFECAGDSDGEDHVESDRPQDGPAADERSRNQREIDGKRRSKSGQRSKSGRRRRQSKSAKRSRSSSSNRQHGRSGRRKHPRHRSRSSTSRSRSRKRSKSRSRKRSKSKSRKRSRSRSRRRSRSRSRKRSSIFSSEPQAADSSKPAADKHQSKFQDAGAGVPLKKENVPDWLKDLANPVPTQYMGRKVLRMPDAYIKCLIGRGGETIRNIINKTGADIRIEGKPDDPDGIVSIAGNIDAAEAMIRSMLAEKGCTWEIRDATGPVGGMSDVTWKSNVDVDDLQIPTELVGLFIGNSGAGIKEIKAKVGGAVTIKVLPPILPGGFQCVQVVGDHWKRAKEIVRAKIEEIKVTTPGRWHTPGFGPSAPALNGTAPSFPGYMPGFGATPGASYTAAMQKSTPVVPQGAGNGTRL